VMQEYARVRTITNYRSSREITFVRVKMLNSKCSVVLGFEKAF